MSDFVSEKPEVSEFGSVDPAPASEFKEVPKLREILCDENERMFQRMRSLFALRNIGGGDSVDALAKAFDSDSALLKHEIAYVLGQMQDDRAVPCLIERLEDLKEDLMVRHEAAEALGAIDRVGGVSSAGTCSRQRLGRRGGLAATVHRRELVIAICREGLRAGASLPPFSSARRGCARHGPRPRDARGACIER